MPNRCARGLAMLVVVLALAGCGGGGDKAKFDSGPIVLAEPGRTVPMGERLFIRYAGLGAAMEPTVHTTLGVTVEQVDEGDASDIEGLGTAVVPYYVHVELENHGDAGIDANGPGGRFTIRGSDGRDYDTEGVISIGGKFEPCPSADAEANLAEGEAIDDCVVIVLKEAVTPRQVRFQGDYAVQQDAVAWKVD
ncbi:MAG TPA: hypothetical protein VKA45_00655 [Gaiellaceae bacterium]|nr:hypothetical protein [Gaiellaceae bacterium]